MRHINKELFLVLTIFSKELLGVSVAGSTIDFYQVTIAVAGLSLYFSQKKTFGLMATLTGILASSVAIFSYYETPISQTFLKQSAAVLFLYAGLGSYLLGCSEQKLASAYIRVCFWMAVFGIVQVILSLRGVDVYICLRGRLDSLTSEPSHYAVAVGPCVYYCFRYSRTFAARCRAVVIIGSVLMTVSATGVAVVSMAFALAFFRQARFAIVVLLAAASPLLLTMIPADAVPEVISSRFTSMHEYFGNASEPWDTTNSTILSFGTNLDVAIAPLAEGRIFGNGFCGHEAAYHRRYSHTEFVHHRLYELNIRSAHCLGIRIISEFGIPGILFTMFTVWYFIVHRRSNLWCMFLLVTFVGRMLKLGSWVDYGIPLFLLSAVYFSATLPVAKRSLSSAGRRSASADPRLSTATVGH
ncbi:MAG: hypothetical protein P8K08_20615 [Fuerstiella sp.]|nr:hypothetical protein [Fuerstiella sp.]